MSDIMFRRHLLETVHAMNRALLEQHVPDRELNPPEPENGWGTAWEDDYNNDDPFDLDEEE